MSLRSKLILATVLTAAFAHSASAQEAGTKIRDSYICVFKSGIAFPGGPSAAAGSAAQSVGASLEHVYTTAIRGFSARMSEQAVARLRANNLNIDYCEQDQIAAVAPVRGAATGGSVSAMSQTVPWGITRVGGGKAGTFPRAWVIDTGIDPTHPDLNVDTNLSRSFLGKRTTYVDQNGHGTHVAGTIAARDNGVGVIGVAPGAQLVSVRVLDRSGSGSNSGVIAGVDYVAKTAKAGDVANMSLGGGISSTLDTAVANAAAKGIYFVLAAGNSNADANTSSPARVNGTNVFTVSASDSADRIASFSNFGNPPVDWAAPGVSVLSTYLGGYATLNGTSMAAPHVAGLLLFGGPSRLTSGGKLVSDKDATPDDIATLAP